MRTIMPNAASQRHIAPSREMRPTMAVRLADLYTQHAPAVEALALAALRRVDLAVDASLAEDVAAEVWLTVSGLAATGALPSGPGAWTSLSQITIAAVIDAHPCDRRERPAGLLPIAAPAPVALDRVLDLVDRVGVRRAPARPLRAAVTSFAIDALRSLPLAG